MCGIVGYAGFTKKVLLDEAVKAIRHRGPDDNGTEYFDGVALGNVRLAIIDISKKGHQPMFSKDKSLCITFNGEIYNFQEIKKLLEKRYQFKSNSDTEVILYAYQEWGVRCLEKLNGMFSFVIFDKKKNLLFGARDRLGQKPLKYYFKNGMFIFASEIKGIVPLLNSKIEIDCAAVDNFLTLQYVPSPRTGFRDIYKLPAAHYFIYKNNTLHVSNYWSLDFRKKLHIAKEEWQELIFQEMKRSVESHLVSDVPVGALLSGGLDSSIIVALMANYFKKRIHTFSIGFDDKRFDETKYATMVSRMYNTQHTQLRVTPRELIGNIERFADIYDEPIGDNSILPMMLVSKLAGRKVKVALTGDGGDENFAGYDRYAFVQLSSILSNFSHPVTRILRLIGTGAFAACPNKLTERMQRFLIGLEKTFYRRYIDYNCFFTNKTKHSLYNKDFRQSVESNDTYEIYRSLYNRNLTDVDNALALDIQTYLPDDLLYKSDSASMAYGLELRSPFLDHTLMEKTASMPSSLKLQFFQKKKILKDIAKRYKLLPKEIVYRRKHGFTIPQNTWFKGPLKKYLISQILSSRMVGEIFDKGKMQRYLADYFNTDLNYDSSIFSLLIFSLWFDRYFK